MDKATPKSSADVFQANRDRAGPLLAKLKAEGIGHVIDGKVVPAASGQTVTFTATANEQDVCVSAIGPGASAERGTGLFKKTRYSGFVFGVLVMAATTEEGTDVSGQRGALVEHGPNDGVGSR